MQYGRVTIESPLPGLLFCVCSGSKQISTTNPQAVSRLGLAWGHGRRGDQEEEEGCKTALILKHEFLSCSLHLPRETRKKKVSLTA